MGQKQTHHLLLEYPNLSQETVIPRKRLEQQKNKQSPALNPPQQNYTTMKTLDASSIIRFLLQVDDRRNLLTDSILLWQKSQGETATKLSPQAQS